MKTKRYILIGDFVIANDGDRHFVSAERLSDLYGLDREECLFADMTRPRTLQGLPAALPHLYPRFDGDYSLPDWMQG